jgi:hypothetical protein
VCVCVRACVHLVSTPPLCRSRLRAR